MGIPPTENPVSIRAIVIAKIRDDKIVERWEQGDMLGLMKQIGAIPALENAGA